MGTIGIFDCIQFHTYVTGALLTCVKGENPEILALRLARPSMEPLATEINIFTRSDTIRDNGI